MNSLRATRLDVFLTSWMIDIVGLDLSLYKFLLLHVVRCVYTSDSDNGSTDISNICLHMASRLYDDSPQGELIFYGSDILKANHVGAVATILIVPDVIFV